MRSAVVFTMGATNFRIVAKEIDSIERLGV